MMPDQLVHVFGSIVAWLAADPRSTILAGGAGLIATLLLWPRSARQPTIDPDYLAWLEAKAELYERGLRFYATADLYRSLDGVGFPVLADGGRTAQELLDNPDFTPQS